MTAAELEEDDPFLAFNQAMGMGFVADPYTPLRAQAAAGPVVTTELLPGMPMVTALGYDAVHEVLRDGERFSSAGYSEIMGPVMGRTILEMDEPEHHAYRSLIQQAFTRKAMEGWEHELVVPVIDTLLDAILERGDGRAELVSQLFFPFPVNVIAGLLGLPTEDLLMFHRRTIELISVSVDMEIALGASRALADYLLPFIAERRTNQGPDMISVLAATDLTDDDILAFCRLLLPAGAETTYRSSSNLFCGLLTNPDQLDEVRADRSLVPKAIEEGLRWEPPLLTIFRTAAVDTEVCGVPIAAGTAILTNLGSANHDDSRWDDPDTFDIHRKAQAHIAFASGPHMCLGMHLARMETRAVVNRVLDRLPNLRLDPAAEPPVVSGSAFRAPLRLDVVFDA